MTNLQVVLREYPQGLPEPGHFELKKGERPVPADGELLSRTLYISLDPYVRGVISGKHLYADRVGLGDVIVGRTVAQVVESHHPDFKAGDLIACDNGWQEYKVSDGSGARKLAADIQPLSLHLGILGMPGLTAYAGMTFLAKPQPGETVVVSAASGPVGSMVGQIAKIHGCRAVGIAGSDAKCAFVTDSLGFDACINYKKGNLVEALKNVCPEKFNVYFDNVAGDTLDAVMSNLAIGARIVLCGMITQYNVSGTPPPGPNLARIVGARASMLGLVVYDYYDRWDEFAGTAEAWFKAGKLRFKEDVVEGLDNAADGFCRLMRGENFGKAIVKLADPE